LAEAIERLGDGGVRDEVNRKLDSVGLQYKGNVRVKHISRALYEDIGLERIGGEVKRDLSDLVVAPHYGCHYLKPRSALAGFEEPDNPKTLHGLIAATGARPIDYETLGLCCGGKAFPVTSELPRLLIQKKLSDLKTRQVDAMVLQCQTCYLMYGDEQREIRDERGEEYDLPVLLYPQLLGLALGADPMEDLGLSLHSISADRVLAKVRER
jgi:heterodisulfide reductase subunit B